MTTRDERQVYARVVWAVCCAGLVLFAVVRLLLAACHIWPLTSEE